MKAKGRKQQLGNRKISRTPTLSVSSPTSKETFCLVLLVAELGADRFNGLPGALRAE